MGKAFIQVAVGRTLVEPCEIEWVADGVDIKMTARTPSVGDTTKRDRDLFGALIQFRLQLEESGRLVLCNAARKDAYPSQMLREMSGGTKIYLLRPGKQAGKEDIRETLGAATYEEIGTVAEQRLGYEAWLRTLT